MAAPTLDPPDVRTGTIDGAWHDEDDDYCHLISNGRRVCDGGELTQRQRARIHPTPMGACGLPPCPNCPRR